MAVEVMTQYDALVQAGREARERADEMQWVEGDLALQVEVLPPDERPRDPETGLFIEDESKALKRYAEDVDMPYSTLRARRITAQAWPRDRRLSDGSWEVHRILAAQEDRFQLIRAGMTVREAKKVVRDRTAGNQGKPGWHELLGKVGDDLIAAEKHLAKATAEITRPEPKIQAKAGRYAAMAEAIAAQLREIEQAA